jgi:hypothetical protein
MKKAEKILLSIAVLGLVMKLLYLPAAGTILVLSISSLIMFYFYLGFAFFNNLLVREALRKESYKNISTKRVIGAIVVGLTLGTCLVPILFKIQSWPAAKFQVFTGLTAAVLVILISLIKYQKSKDKYYSTILKRVVVFGALALSLLVIPSKTWLSWNFPNNPEYVNAVLEAEASPNNLELRSKVEEEQAKMYEKVKN